LDTWPAAPALAAPWSPRRPRTTLPPSSPWCSSAVSPVATLLLVIRTGGSCNNAEIEEGNAQNQGFMDPILNVRRCNLLIFSFYWYVQLLCSA
jgi:hypothetical protein